jgi:hypothetical protein
MDRQHEEPKYVKRDSDPKPEYLSTPQKHLLLVERSPARSSLSARTYSCAPTAHTPRSRNVALCATLMT